MYKYPIKNFDYFSNLLAITPDLHSMGASLKRYLEIKVPVQVKDCDYKQIIVRGRFDRSIGMSNREKTDKLFNYMRPTANIDNMILYINCFPGIDYVFHYGNIMKSYITIINKNVDVLSITPTEKECWEVIEKSGLKDVPIVPTVIMGYVEGVNWISDDKIWHGTGNFLWKRVKLSTGEGILLGCKHTYWGEIAGRIGDYLASKGTKRIIYSGKLGTLNPELVPNLTIATGDCSILPNGEKIKWNNIFENLLDVQVYNGIHITLPSVLQETNEWLKQNRGQIDFVDPEIGHMALAARENNIIFSYFHVISDNLSKKFESDLSNERKVDVINNRKQLYKKIGSAIISL